MKSQYINDSYESEESLDLTSVIAEFPYGDDYPGEMIPIKKLCGVFEGCIKSEDYMNVFLRVRPINAKLETDLSGCSFLHVRMFKTELRAA